jgi:Anti-sigma-K factor rskA
MFEALAVAWAIDSLEPADQVTFEAHWHGCAHCEQTVLTMLEVAAELAYGVPDVEPPAQLRRRILAAATPRPPTQATSPEDAPRGEPDPGGPPAFSSLDLVGDSNRARAADRRGPAEPEMASREAGGRPPARGRRRAGGARRTGRDRPGSQETGSRRRRIVSVLAAVALVGISAATTWEVTRPAAVSAPSAAGDRTAALSSPASQGTVATVVLHDGRADVVTDALEPNAAGRSFFVWGVPAGGAGRPQVVGTFQVTTDGLHSFPVQLTRSLEGYPVLAISEEATGSTPVKPSDVIARGALDH